MRTRMMVTNYRSVPLIRPPHFVHYIEPKVGGGLVFEYAISVEYKPPPPQKSFTRPLRTLPITMATSFRIESTVHGHHVYIAS